MGFPAGFITLDPPNPTNASTVSFTVGFLDSISQTLETVTGVDAGDFSLVATGLTGASITGVTGSGSTYTVTVNTGTGSGTLELQLIDNDTIKDVSNIPLGGPGLGNGDFTLGSAFTVDRAPPTVSSIVRTDASPTAASTVHYTVTFSESVNNVDVSDFILATTGTTGTITGVSGSGATYTVTVGSITGVGTLQLQLKDDDSITDDATNHLGGTGTVGAGDGSFTTGQIYSLVIPPAVTSITRADASPTNAGTVDFTVTFSTAVTGVDASDFVAGGSATFGSPLVVSGSGTTYTVTVNGVAGDGTLQLNLADDDSIKDTNSIPLGGTGAGNGNFTTGQVYTIDNTPPTVTSIVRAGTDPTNASAVQYTVTFSEAVTGVGTSDFLLTATGSAVGSIVNVGGSGTTYTVTVNSVTGDGTLRLDVKDDDSIKDAATNVLGGTGTVGAGDGSFTTGQFYTVDHTPPTVTSIVRADTNPTGAASVTYTVKFSEAVTGVDLTDFHLVPNGLSGTSLTNVTGSGDTYTVTVGTGISGDGTLELDLVDDDTIKDAAGNALGGTGAHNGDTAGQVYSVLHEPPKLVSAVPVDNAVDVLIGANIVLTFDKAVKAGAGNIVLHPATGTNITIAVTDATQVTFTGNQMVINPTADLRPGVDYDVQIGNGVVTDTVGNVFAGVALDALDFTTSFIIPAGTFATSFTITDPGTYTLLGGTTRTQTASPAVVDTGLTGDTTIDIEGKLDGASGRAIDANVNFTAGKNLTIIAGLHGTIISATNDAIRINKNIPGTLTIDNLGVIVSGTVDGSGNIGGTGGGQALDLDAVSSPTHTFINNGVGALIGAADADAIRPGANATINNFGAIKGQSTGDGGNNGIDFQANGGGVIVNHGTIEGASHAITGQKAISLTNYATITGHLGSGVNMDTDTTVGQTTTIVNQGTIIGTGGFLNNDPAKPTDGDGIDVDGLLNLDNYGTIRAVGSDGVDRQEAVTIGGGTINNFAGGLIISVGRAITVDDSGGGGGPGGANGSNGGNAWAPTIIYNEGKIEGDNGEAISITDTFADTLTNKGTIIGSVFLGGGADIVNAYAGAAFSGLIDGGTGTDTINLIGPGVGKLANVANFEMLSVQSGTWTIADTEGYSGGVTIAGGTLAVDGSLDGSVVAVLNGGTLGGHGVVGAVNVASGGTLSPGASPGMLTTGNLTLGTGAILKVEISGNTAGTSYDQVHVNGIVDVTGATLSGALVSGFTPGPGATFKIIDNDGADAVVGKFVGLAEGATVDFGGTTFAISYKGGDGNDVTLTNTATNQAPPPGLPPQASFTGTTGNDSFTAQPGSSSIDAGTGIDTVTFNFKLVDATITFSGNQVIVDGPNGVSHTVLTGFEVFNFSDGQVNNNDSNPLVDDLFYYSHYHDVWNAHADADQHYETVGWKEGRNPDAFFDTNGYLARYADVKAAGINPLDHYDQSGWKEGRDPSVNFDTKHYLAAYGDVAAAHIDPLAHFLHNGLAEGRSAFGDGVFA